MACSLRLVILRSAGDPASKVGRDGNLAGDVTANGQSRDVVASDAKIRGHQ